MNRRHLFAAVAAAAFTLGAGASAAEEPIRIGSFLAVTGPAAFLGDPEKKTLELYVKKLDEQGGVLGRPLELIVYDTGSNAKDAVTFVKRLIEQDRVDFIIGGTTTGETMAVINFVEEAEIPFISLAGAAVIVEPVRKWVFKTPHSDRMAVQKVYEDMKKEGHRKVGLIAGTGGFDKSCLQHAEELAPAYGLEVVATEQYGPDDTDVTPQLTRIRDAGAEAVLFCGFGAPSVIVAKNFARLGMKSALYYNHGACSKRFVEGAGEAAEGIRIPCAALVVAEQLPPDDPQREVTLAYKREYESTYGEEVSTFGGHAYDALMLLVDAIRRAGTTDRAAVRDALEQTKEFVGVDGIYNVSPEDHMGLDLRSFKMLEVRGGDWKLLY
ncbi:Leu/Ile/Val-binding protein [bacterium HR39]|nr:Leu/Ile/Val-binding protein [bacterium HR39]